MRKQVLASLPLLGLAACGGDDTNPASSTTTAASTTGTSATSTAGDSSPDSTGPGGDTSGDDSGASDGNTAGDSATTTTTSAGEDTSDSGELDPVAICEAYEVVYDECVFPEYAKEEFCDEYVLDLLTAGDACAQGWLEMFACLSQLDCNTLNDNAQFPCRSEYESANRGCPETFGPCATGENAWDGATCYYAFERCLDDATYRIDCAPDGATSTCTCTTDGQESGTFEVATDMPDCFGADYRTGAEESCGFPAGLIPLD